MSYGKQMAIEGFFNVPAMPQDLVGGWYIEGHDANDEYQDLVIPILVQKTAGARECFA